MIQDILPDRLFNEYRPQAAAVRRSPVLCFQGQNILARVIETKDRVTLEIPTLEMLQGAGRRVEPVYGFAVNDTEYFLDIAGHDDGDQRPEGFSYLDTLQLRHALPNVYGMIVYTGYHLHMWYRGRRFCGACGHPTVHDNAERAVCCPVCGSKNYPRIMPAVIVGVLNGDRLLVTKYKEGFRYFALIAGFTEIGETLEETVAREVMEETGLRVTNIRYYKSQPWGIAGDVLAGFYCDVEGDCTITMDRSELKVAEWKYRHEIELQPDGYSLTNEMMKRFKDGEIC